MNAKRGLRGFAFALLAVWGSSCVTASEVTRQRASFDFNCPEDKITTTLVSGGENTMGATIGARGCGKRAVYVRAQAGMVLNSPIQTEDAPTPGSSAPGQ
jgi:hypothetical protein